MKEFLRRSSKDPQWQAVKKIVYERDKSCRLVRVLTAQELSILKKNAGYRLRVLDPAHYLAVSDRPDLCYKSYNICLLNRYSHIMLDDLKHPIYGTPISKEEALRWWERILSGDPLQYKYLKTKNLL